ncbi:MAG: CheY-like chemotaxis protein [Planctomycetota bacterium]|jgi:CheY-like chemotaxis protein
MTTADIANLRVLLVEDFAINQKVALRMLAKLGIDADCVENGEEAVQAHAKNGYDLILMDCEMPILNGFDATGKIRESEDSGDHVSIIAMTAHYGDDEERRCKDAGMDDFIAKPIRVDGLRAKITEVTSS